MGFMPSARFLAPWHEAGRLEGLEAKGLEAEYVFLAYMNGIHVPGANDPEEERRVLYVALTRAKRDVIVTFHEQWTREKYYARDAMCPFLDEIDDYITVRRLTAPELRGQ